LKEATLRAQTYIRYAIELAPELSKGNGPLAHNWPTLYPEIADQIKV